MRLPSLAAYSKNVNGENVNNSIYSSNVRYIVVTILLYNYPDDSKQYMKDFLNAFDWLDWWLLWHINHCRLLNVKFCVYIYID